MISGVKNWLVRRRWWQELLILWLLYVAVMPAVSVVTVFVLGWSWTDVLTDSPYKFGILAFSVAAFSTCGRRWERRRSAGR